VLEKEQDEHMTILRTEPEERELNRAFFPNSFHDFVAPSSAATLPRFDNFVSQRLLLQLILALVKVMSILLRFMLTAKIVAQCYFLRDEKIEPTS
jgi:hypothetical protein